MEIEKKINYGRLLKRAINRKGLTKYMIAKQLKISRPTLEIRMIDGEFNAAQMEVVLYLIKK